MQRKIQEVATLKGYALLINTLEELQIASLESVFFSFSPQCRRIDF